MFRHSRPTGGVHCHRVYYVWMKTYLRPTYFAFVRGIVINVGYVAGFTSSEARISFAEGRKDFPFSFCLNARPTARHFWWSLLSKTSPEWVFGTG